MSHKDLKISVEKKTSGPAQWENVVNLTDKDLGMYIGLEGDWVTEETRSYLTMGYYNDSKSEIPMPNKLDWYLKDCTFKDDFSRYLSNFFVKKPSQEIEEGLKKL